MTAQIQYFRLSCLNQDGTHLMKPFKLEIFSKIAIQLKLTKNKESLLNGNDGRTAYTRDGNMANSRFCDKCHAMSQYDLNEPVWNNGATAKRN